MPINSFENYPMSWKPDKQKLAYPVYYSLADLMEQDIKSGKLAANTKLPPTAGTGGLSGFKSEHHHKGVQAL